VLTLILGAWVTLGRSHPHLLQDRSNAMIAALNEAIDRLIGGGQ